MSRSRQARLLRAVAPHLPGRRAGREATRRALTLAGVVLLLVFIPLIVGYGWLQQASWRQLAAAGVHPAATYYGLLPLQLPRLLVLSLFSLDVSLWVCLLALLPVDDLGDSVFLDARRRLRRRWLLAHAPLAPLAALLAGARLYGEALSFSGAGATWFDPVLLATAHPPAAQQWIDGEHLLLLSLGACFAVHLILLAGLMQPRHRWRNFTGLLVFSAALVAAGDRLLLPMADGGLVRSMRRASSRFEAACAGLGSAPLLERAEIGYSVFARTSADSPALRSLPPVALPVTSVALPPLPLLEGPGIEIDVSGTGSGPEGHVAGFERRLPFLGPSVDWPIPAACGDVRVFKADRGLPWSTVGAELAQFGDGRVWLAYHAMPAATSLGIEPIPLRLRLAAEESAAPAETPRSILPLPLPEVAGAEAGTRHGRTFARLSGSADHPYRRDHPLDPLWQEALPLPLSPERDDAGRSVFLVPPQTSWDDVLRALAAASASRVQEVTLIPATRRATRTPDRRR